MKYIDMPDTLSKKNGSMVEYSKDDIAVNNSIRNILSTDIGSVPGHPEFGSNITRYLFQQIDPLISAMVEEELRYAIGRWEPRINITSVVVEEDADYNRVLVRLNYKIKSDVKSSEYEYIYKQVLS
ncbi:MAG: GPW/gp25 family protein [Sulfuricurvum sp.]